MHPLDKIANKWTDEEKKFFENQIDSKDIFQLELTGNKRTGDQIENWKSPSVLKMEQHFKNWDGKLELNFEIKEGGEIRTFNELLGGESVPQELPEIGQMILYKSSKITDFIKGSFLEQYGLIVSDKAKSILDSFNIGHHKYYPLEIVHKSEIYSDYWFLRSSASVKEYIDFEKSIFYRQKGLFGFSSRELIEINSKEELNTYRSKVEGQDIYVKASEIYLNHDFPNYDLFVSKEYGIQGIFISTQLKTRITSLTGMEIKSTKRIK